MCVENSDDRYKHLRKFYYLSTIQNQKQEDKMSSELKQVILVRQDLKMKKSQVASLVAKASTEFFIVNDESVRSDTLSVRLTPEETDWINSGSIRVVLGVGSETTLRSLAFKAELAGLQCYPVDGKIFSDGEDGPMETLCIAIGPDQSKKIDEITKNLKLL
jgi:peptidyl-tRNA hydrolase